MCVPLGNTLCPIKSKLTSSRTWILLLTALHTKGVNLGIVFSLSVEWAIELNLKRLKEDRSLCEMLRLSVQRKHVTQCFHLMTWFRPWNPKPRLFPCCGRWSSHREKAQPQGGTNLGFAASWDVCPWAGPWQCQRFLRLGEQMCSSLGRTFTELSSQADYSLDDAPVPGQFRVLIALQFFSALLPTTPKFFQVTFKRLNQCSKHIDPNQVVTVW